MKNGLIIKAMVDVAKNELNGGNLGSFENDNTKTVAEILKSVSSPADTITDGWAAELMQEEHKGFFDLLAEHTIYFNLAKHQMTLDVSKTNNLTYAKRDGSASLGGEWIKEGEPISVAEGLLSASNLRGYKMGIISVFTEEISKKSNLPQILENGIASDTRKALDTKFLSSDALVAETSPAGLGVSATAVAITSAGAATTASELISQISARMGAVKIEGGAGTGTFLLNLEDAAVLKGLVDDAGVGGYRPFYEEMGKGEFMGQRYMEGSEVTKGEIWYIPDNSVLMSLPIISVDTSRNATIVMARPAEPISEGGTATTLDTRSTFQTQTVALRVIYNDLGFDCVLPAAVTKFTGYLS